MKLGKQAGYMDMQVTPAIIGAVLLFATVGIINDPGFDIGKDLLKIIVFLVLATGSLLYGFMMHLDALSCPESPFNKHSSPVFMTVLCAGMSAFSAYQFYSAGIRTGFILYALLALLIITASIGSAVYRNNKPDH